MRRGAVLTLLAAALPMALGGCQGMPAEAPVREQAAEAQPVSAPAPAALPDTTPEQVRDDYDEVLRQASVLGRAEQPREQVRALIGMATLRLMPSSKVADSAAAAVVMRELDLRLAAHELRHEFHAQLELLRLLQAREGEMQALRESNRKLAAQLAAKEELVRQLRALSVDGG